VVDLLRTENTVEATNPVQSYYSDPEGSQPYSFEKYKQGSTWKVLFKIRSITGVEEYEWDIDSETGLVHPGQQ
jgi:hypothetical protein